MHYPKPATARRRVRELWLLLLLPAVVLSCSTPSATDQAEPTDAENTVIGKYLGRWNFDLPDRATLTNIAKMNLPGREQVPQIGDIVFTAEGADRVIGRTDVGCTWRFKATSDSLELDPPSQLCHNPTSNVAYTLTRWTVTVDGDREKEITLGKSHRPERDYDFVLENGARTKVTEYDPDAATKFAGTWAYDPADTATGVNIRTIRTAAEGMQNVQQSAEQGYVTITTDGTNRLTARTDNGCTWLLVARGNTAKLDPPIQTCTLPTSTAITIRSWNIATNSNQQASVMTGTDEHGGNFALSGSLSRN